MSDEPTASAIIDELRRVLDQAHDELERNRHAMADAACVLVQKDARIALLTAAVRQSGHDADRCALQYGGACDCRMQLTRDRSTHGL